MEKEITYRQMEAEFLQFLKENNALHKFRKNVKKQKYCSFVTLENYINPFTIEPIKKLFTLEGYNNLVNFAFIWSETKEGHDYWSNLDRKWGNKFIGITIKIINEKINE